MGVPYVIITLNSKVMGRKEIDKAEITIGRAAESDVVIENLAVSRNHAKIHVPFGSGGSMFVKDLRSANGTFLNGQRVDEAQLKNGDIILVGKHVLKFCEEETPKSEQAQALVSDGNTVLVDTQARQKFLERWQSEKAVYPKLVLSSGSKEVKIDNDFFTIGKEYGSDLRVEGFLIKSPHATIVRKADGSYRLVSTGSFLMPTKVNGTKVKEKNLRHGDIIQIGRHQIIFTR